MYRILVAEDERLEREALRFVLQQMNDLVSEVSVVANGRQAIDEAGANPPDIAVIDIRMPGITGIEAARSIKQAHPGCHIIFLTAFNYFDYAQEAIRLHADDFLIKPVSNARLEQVIRETASRLATEGVAARSPRTTTDERALAESKLIGDAVLGQIDEQVIRGYLGLGPEQTPGVTAVVMRIEPDREHLAAHSAEQRRLLKRRVLSLLRHECDQAGVALIASAEATSIYALMVEPPQPPAAGLAHADATPRPGEATAAGTLQAAVEAAERQLGVVITIGRDGPAPGFERLGLRLANAKVASRAGAETDTENKPAGSRRAVLDAEQALVRAVAGESDTAVEDAVRDLMEAVTGVTGGEPAQRAELADAMTYVAHATAMQVGSFPDDVTALIGSLADTSGSTEPRALLLSAAAIAKRLAEHVASVKETTHWAVKAARAWIDEHFAEDLALETIAARVRLSPFYLSRVFKASLGTTVLDYVTANRVEHARRLMHESTLSIKEIAAQVGYSDQNYFSRVFRRVTGTTPSAYRRTSE